MSARASLLHVRVRTDLEEAIRAGRCRPGDKLPTEMELQSQYGVSRVTVQRAMRDLAQMGLVVRHRSRGSFVAQNATEENLLRLTNLIPHGPELEGAHQVQAAHVVPAAEAGIDLPGVDGAEPVHLLHRSKRGPDDKPSVVEVQAVVFRHAPHLLDEPLDTLTTLQYYRTHQIPVARSRMYVEPINLTAELARQLELEPGRATFRLRRLLWLVSGDLVEAGLHVLAPDALHLYVEQTLAVDDTSDDANSAGTRRSRSRAPQAEDHARTSSDGQFRRSKWAVSS